MNCKHCENSTGFFHWAPQDPFILAFREVKPIKFGTLVSCPGCETLFSLTAEAERADRVEMIRIEKDELPALEKWNSTPLVPTPEQLKTLQIIGATPPDIYTNGSGQILVPCRCILRDGTEIDYCLLRLQKLPPVKSNLGDARFYLLNEVKEIFPSDFALSQAVRYATTRAEEIRMSLAPTVVIGPDGTKYYFNWTNDFIAHNGWKGDAIHTSDVSAADALEVASGGLLTFEQPVTYLIGDWQDEFAKMRIALN